MQFHLQLRTELSSQSLLNFNKVGLDVKIVVTFTILSILDRGRPPSLPILGDLSTRTSCSPTIYLAVFVLNRLLNCDRYTSSCGHYLSALPIAYSRDPPIPFYGILHVAVGNRTPQTIPTEKPTRCTKQ